MSEYHSIVVGVLMSSAIGVPVVTYVPHTSGNVAGEVVTSSSSRRSVVSATGQGGACRDTRGCRPRSAE